MSSEQPLSNDPQVVLSARGLGKLYTLYARPQDRLKQSIFKRFGKGTYGHSFWALRGVSFDLRRGETFAVIGRNGSGKSTLLQILAGILTPSEGRIEAHGRVAALLELGSGFNPEFTGRENVLFYGSILDISRAEMLQRLEEIIAFADIGEFIDQPVKTYSSGMFVRLAFSVAVGVQADILLIDEALAVGDIFFRQKCYRRLEELRAKGVAIVLVSHAMNEVEQFCERALLLDGGEVRFLGGSVDAVKRYYLIEQGLHPDSVPPVQPAQPVLPAENQSIQWPEPETYLDLSGRSITSNGWGHCTAIAVTDQLGQPASLFQQGAVASIFFEFEIDRPIQVPLGGFQLQNEKGIIVHGRTSLELGPPSPSNVPVGQRIRFRYDIALEIAPGEYTFEVGFSTIDADIYQRRASLAHPDLYGRVTRICTVTGLGPLAVSYRNQPGQTQLMHHGLANLPGSLTVSLD